MQGTHCGFEGKNKGSELQVQPPCCLCWKKSRMPFPSCFHFLFSSVWGPHLVDCSGVTLDGAQGTLWCLELSPELPRARPGTQPFTPSPRPSPMFLRQREHRACTVSQLRTGATRPLFQLTQPSTGLCCLLLNISSLFPNILAQGIICFQMSVFKCLYFSKSDLFDIRKICSSTS